MKATSKMILMDWQRGKIPYFVAPPNDNKPEQNKEEKDVEVVVVEGDDKNKKFNIDQNIDELLVTNEFLGNQDNKINNINTI